MFQVGQEVLSLLGHPRTEPKRMRPVVNRDLNDASYEVILFVNDAGIGRQLDAFFTLLLRDAPPLIGLVCTDVG